MRHLDNEYSNVRSVISVSEKDKGANVDVNMDMDMDEHHACTLRRTSFIICMHRRCKKYILVNLKPFCRSLLLHGLPEQRKEMSCDTEREVIYSRRGLLVLY